MEPVNKVILSLVFADATSRNLTFNGVETSALSSVKNKIILLNVNMPPALAATFVSDNGAALTMIRAARIVITTEEVIYSAS